jgi:hypothetical protein
VTSRPGIIVAVRAPADGTGATMGTTSGYSDHAYLPAVTAEVRLHWPPRATREQCLDTLNQAVEEAMDKFDRKYEEGVGRKIEGRGPSSEHER